MTVKVEICVNSDFFVERSVRAAYQGGADTVELCSQMTQQGLTPTAEQIALARAAFAGRKGLMVMIRPRAGDFCYSKTEIDRMLGEIETAVSLGADGVVFGALKGVHLDIPMMRKLTNTALNHGIVATCHRVFDAAASPIEALEMLIDLGVNRVLTSGTPWGSHQSAVDGIPRLMRLIEQANDRIELVLGGGIHQGNVCSILAQLPTQNTRLSLHVYSAVLRDGMTNVEAVRQLVNKVATKS